MTTALPTTENNCERPDSNQVYDVLTVLTLLLGGFLVPVVGWLAGVILLWASPRWSTGQKWLGTLVWPGVVVAPAAVGFAVAAIVGDRGGAGAGIVAAIVVGALGLLVALPLVCVRLLRARRRA